MVVGKLAKWLCGYVFLSYLSKEGNLNFEGKASASISGERGKTSLIAKSSSNYSFWIFLTASINLVSSYPWSWFMVFIPSVSRHFADLSKAPSLFSFIFKFWLPCRMSSLSCLFSSFVSIFSFSRSFESVIHSQKYFLHWWGFYYCLL